MDQEDFRQMDQVELRQTDRSKRDEGAAYGPRGEEESGAGSEGRFEV